MPSWLKRMGGGTLIFGTVGSLAIILIVITLLDSNSPVTEDVARPLPSPVAAAKAPSPKDAAVTLGAVPVSRIEPVAFLDASRRGTADFGNSDFDAAKTKFEQALKNKPDDPELANNLGLALERLGQIDAAIARYMQAVQLDGKTWAYHFNLAHAVAVRQEWDRAIAEYRVARDLFPTDYATQYNLAMTLHRKGDELAAIPEYEKAIALAPGESQFHLSLGASLEKAGRVSDAKREYQQYLDMAPGAVDADKVRAHLQGLT